MSDDDMIWFGKHEGELLRDVPDSYLEWLYDEMIDDPPPEGSKRDELLTYIQEERM